ncbi:MAG: TetR/AcrR family transcriptional regulator [Nocardioides sp.]|uniref:TetR/AcrR family transcriptional regulator n=1 Tax=Nocardioides sp. TaxID=35761 RepID=UPI0039E59C1A
MAGDSRGARDGRQTRWDGHKEERRRQIIAAAIETAQESEPGVEIHVQEIAERAGLSRTVVYRHFSDRADLDRAVQAEILDQVWDLLLPQVVLEGTVPEIIRRIIEAYVTWAVEHPALHRLADHDSSHENGPLEVGLERLAEQITDLLVLALPAEPLDGGRAVLDAMVYGIVGAAFSTVRRWISKPDRTLSAAMVTELVSDSVWFVVQGHALRFGVALSREMRAEEFTGAVADAGSLPT